MRPTSKKFLNPDAVVRVRNLFAQLAGDPPPAPPRRERELVPADLKLLSDAELQAMVFKPEEWATLGTWSPRKKGRGLEVSAG